MKKMQSPVSQNKPFDTVFETQVYLMLDDAAFRDELNAAVTMDERIFFVVKTLVNRIFAHYVASLRSANSLNIVSAIKESVALVSSNLFVSLPYLVAFMQQSADCQIARDVRQAFKVDDPKKIALITDTFFDVNGVSISIKRMISEAVRRNIDFTVVTCVSPEDVTRHMLDPVTRQYLESGRLKLFISVANLGFPQYDGLQICFPPMLDMLKYLQEGGFTKIQLSTPGVIGIAGLIAGKLLQIETAATYHTSIPEYVENYTKDVSLEAIAWKYMLFFYHAVDEVLVPSKFVAKLLHKRGLRNRKLLILDRWVNVDQFHPRNRNEGHWSKVGIANDVVKFVYVGRVATEKNLHVLAQAFTKLASTRADAHMIIIGDGPYRSTLAAQLAGLPVTFTGYLHRDELATALASCDVKVFPSTTDTWGNAPLEAQASGLPVIVTDIGGPAELMQHGITGLMVRGNDVRSLHDAMLQLMSPVLRQTLGCQARMFAEANRVDEPFTAVLDSEAHRRQLRKRKRKLEKVESQKAPQRPPFGEILSTEAANQPYDSLIESSALTNERGF
jgi:glycosyltransferase involved in cell wall biosynthesis